MKKPFLKSLLYVLGALALVCLGVFGALQQVDATDVPTTYSILDSYGYQNLLETGDMAIIAYYNIYYAGTLPVEPASETFFINVMRPNPITGTVEVVDNLQPYAYNDLGYNRGVVGFYWNKDTVDTLHITSSNITLQIAGNPLVSFSGTITALGGSVGHWPSVAPSNEEMGRQIINWALQLQNYWQLQLVGSVGMDMYLEEAGVNYFAFSVENVMQICPEIFKYRTQPPQYKTWTASLTVFPTIATGLMPTAAGTIFGVGTGALTTGMVGIGIVVFLVVIMMRQPRLGRYAFLLAGVLVIFYTRMNQMVDIWVTVVGVIALFVVGYLVFYEKSAA